MKLSECKGQSFLINGKILGYQSVLKMIYEGKLFGPISLVNIDKENDLSGVMSQMSGQNDKDKSLSVLQTEMIEVDITKEDLKPLNPNNTMFAVRDASVIYLSECLEDDYMFTCDGRNVELSDILGMIYNNQEISPIQAIQMDTMFPHENAIAMQRLWNDGVVNDNKELSLLKTKNVIIDIKPERIEKIPDYDDMYVVKQKQKKPKVVTEVEKATPENKKPEEGNIPGMIAGMAAGAAANSIFPQTPVNADTVPQPEAPSGFAQPNTAYTNPAYTNPAVQPDASHNPAYSNPEYSNPNNREGQAPNNWSEGNATNPLYRHVEAYATPNPPPSTSEGDVRTAAMYEQPDRSFARDEERDYPRSARAEKEIPKRRKKGKAQKKLWYFLTSAIGWVINAAVLIVTVYIVINFVIINAEIPSESMDPTVEVGDKIIGNRLAYTFEKPERGDIAVFKNPDNPNELYIKRIIGLPGETIVIDNGKIYINGATEPLNEPYLTEEWTEKNSGMTFEVPEGCYFMLGDNRNISYDARYWVNTYVPKDYLVAEAVLRYFPVNSITILNEHQSSYYLSAPSTENVETETSAKK